MAALKPGCQLADQHIDCRCLACMNRSEGAEASWPQPEVSMPFFGELRSKCLSAGQRNRKNIYSPSSHHCDPLGHDPPGRSWDGVGEGISRPTET